MKYIINEVKINLNDYILNKNNLQNILLEKISNKLKINKNKIKINKIIKKSIDSRNKAEIKYSFNIIIEIENNISFDKKLVKENNYFDEIFIPIINNNKLSPIIIGSGPSGLFCGLTLARMGLKAIIVEQGKIASARARDVEKFWEENKLNTKSNVQFGFGGAGTFSDGKLNTGINSPLVNYVLKQYHIFGADEEITYSSAPHIGTDVLIEVIENIRKEIEKLGGKFLFEHEFVDFELLNNKVKYAILKNNDKIIKLETDKIILCIGHSSRQTFRKLKENNVKLEAKPLSIGLRIQHKQSTISKAQYGKDFEKLPPADYKLSCFLENKRCVYTFCMCPGGYVVNASSEDGFVVCNGMSYNARDSENANSAILVNVNTEDFETCDALAGVEFQEKWERKAFEIAGGQFLPIQTLQDFLENKTTTKLGNVNAVCKGKTVFANLNDCLPSFASDAIKKAVFEFDKKIKGFANPISVLVGVETRSSSPVRILRDENFETNIKGLYSCGEGAGYAGGITSSSVDGVKLALLLYNEKK